MKVLLDECVPAQVRHALPGHDVSTVSEMGWKGRENGELLDSAERAGFEVLVIADKNLRYQQNLSGRRIALIELWTNHRPTLERHFAQIAPVVSAARPGAHDGRFPLEPRGAPREGATLDALSPCCDSGIANSA